MLEDDLDSQNEDESTFMQNYDMIMTNKEYMTVREEYA